MVKKLLLLLLVCMTLVAYSRNGSATNLGIAEIGKPDLCDAPPPDSFRVTDISSGLVSLSWVPAWVGANHTMVLSVEDSSGTWSDLITYYSVPGDSYSFTVSMPGSYKITNATNCTSGEVSFRYSEVRFKLIELTTAGRVPLNPIPVSNCNSIDYLNHEWVGFRVRERATNRSNLFEFQEVGASGYVKRVADVPSIFAVDNYGEYPKGNQHLKIPEFSFEMHDKIKPEPRIGFIEIIYNASPAILGICIDDSEPWKSEYEFTVLTAENVLIVVPPGGGTGQGFGRQPVQSKFTAQSPFSNNLTVFAPSSNVESEDVTIQLFNANGRQVLRQKFNLHDQKCHLVSELLTSGLYFLQIETKVDCQIIKVFKSE